MSQLRLHAPSTIGEATTILADYGGDARAIAGGTALVLMLRQGLVKPSALVRLERITGMNGISIDGDVIRLGALATLRDLSASSLVQQRLPVLAQACALVGNVAGRNAATIGGNACEADYASDPPGVLGSRREGSNPGPLGGREVAVADLITDFYETSLAQDELVSEVVVPIPATGTTAVYIEVRDPVLGRSALCGGHRDASARRRSNRGHAGRGRGRLG